MPIHSAGSAVAIATNTGRYIRLQRVLENILDPYNMFKIDLIIALS